jgi:hypothetical protein
MEVENPEVKEIKLAEEKNVSMKEGILDSLKTKWGYFRNKIMSLVACTTNTGVNNKNVNIDKEEPKEKELVKETTIVEEPQQPQEVVEESFSEASPDVAVTEDALPPLPVASPVVVEEPITLDERI